MATHRLRRLTALAAMLGLLTAGGVGRAETGISQAAQADFSKAQFVSVVLGTTNEESGLRLLDNQPDGQTQPPSSGAGRQSSPNQAGGSRWFYFGVHDTYVQGGQNKVLLTFMYEDVGLRPIYLEYDAFDPARPLAKVEELTRKRVHVVNRTNSGALLFARITLEDARFLGGQPGGADFRIGSEDDLVLRQISVLRQAHRRHVPIEIVLASGEAVFFDPDDVQPFVDPVTSRTLAPVRAMFNALGIPNEGIAWDNETRTVTATNGQTTIILTIDSDRALVNGAVFELDQPAVIVASRTVVPARFVAEHLGYKVDPFFSDTRRLILLTPASAPKEPQQQP